MLDHMPENMKEIAFEEFGSVDQWREYYIEAVSKEKVQKQYANYDGMREGYELAKFRLNLLNGMPFGVADEYWNDNAENIRSILDLCKQYETCGKR